MTDSSEIGVMQCKSWDTKYTNLHFFWSLGDLSRPYPEAHLGSGKDRSSATKMAGKRRGDGEYLKSEFKWPPPGAIAADGDQLMGNRGTRNGNLGMWPVQEENTHTQIHTISHNYTCICAVFEHEYIDNHWLIWCNHWLVWGKNTEVPSFSPLQPMNMRPMFIKPWAKRQEPPFTRWKKRNMSSGSIRNPWISCPAKVAIPNHCWDRNRNPSYANDSRNPRDQSQTESLSNFIQFLCEWNILKNDL